MGAHVAVKKLILLAIVAYAITTIRNSMIFQRRYAIDSSILFEWRKSGGELNFRYWLSIQYGK